MILFVRCPVQMPCAGCRFVVAQNRQAVHVFDPLRLAHRLEVLGGTAGFVDLIAMKQALISEHSKSCAGLTEEAARSNQSHHSHVSRLIFSLTG